MKLNIKIIKDGELTKTADLGPGKYKVGRGTESDVVLPDKSVSKKHATLAIKKNKITVTDRDSTNGIYHNGEKIESKTFDSDFEVEIGVFVMKGTLPKKIAYKEKKLVFFEKIASTNIKTLSFISLAVMMLLTFAAVYFPLGGQVRDYQARELEKRGVMLAKYLSEINRYYFIRGLNDLVTTYPISEEEGVVNVYIVNSRGKVLAPEEDLGKFKDVPELHSAMQEGKLKIVDEGSGRKTIYYPLRDQNKTIAVTAILYDFRQAGESIESDVKSSSYGLLLMLLVICGVLASLMMKAFLLPLKKLGEEVSVAAKDGRGTLDFKSPYKEIDNLSEAFNRLLAKASIGKPEPAEIHEDQTVSIPRESSPPSSLVSYMSTLKEQSDPWCVIDTGEYIIVDHNSSFGKHLKNSESQKGVHILEAFDNPEVMNTISELIDAADEKLAAIDNLEIKKMTFDGENNIAAFIFSEKL